ncbi:hypothetical protein STEG23_014370 [Scotinomys teguina]
MLCCGDSVRYDKSTHDGITESYLGLHSGVVDINTDYSCNWAKDPDMAPGSSPGLEDTMVLGGITDHLDQHGPNSNMALEPPHGPRCGPRFQASTLPFMETGTTDISTDTVCDKPSIVTEAADIDTDPGCCGRAMDPDIAYFCSSSGLEDKMDLGDIMGHQICMALVEA